MHTQEVQEVTVTALSSKVVIKFISSFWGRGNFCQSRHFVRVCEWVCVSVCLPAPSSWMLRDCVWSRFGQLSTFQKDLSPAAGKKRSEDRNWCVEWMRGRSLVIFVRNNLWRLNIFEEKKKELCVWVVLWGVKGRGCAFFLPFDLHSCTYG